MRYFCAHCAIIPSSMLRKLALLDEFSAERDALLASADAAAFLRGHRAALPAPQTLGPARAGKALERHRDVFNADNGQALPGKLARTEGGPPSADTAVNEAYDATGLVYDFYAQVLARRSIDGTGMALESTVHSARARDNAFWDGRQMVFGDPTPNGPFTGSMPGTTDVVAHELAHGVTQFCVRGGLDYVGQSGALNESWSDVFGSVVKQWSLKQDVRAADWLIGAGLLKPQYGQALRSMKAPGTAWIHDNQPSSMTDYVPGGDVHTNSGIPNHAFYLAANAIGGKSWESAAVIWYRALPLLNSRASFVEAAHATRQAAAALFGEQSIQAEAVGDAWHAVRVI